MEPKMKMRILSMFLMVCLILTGLPFPASAEMYRNETVLAEDLKVSDESVEIESQLNDAETDTDENAEENDLEENGVEKEQTETSIEAEEKDENAEENDLQEDVIEDQQIETSKESEENIDDIDSDLEEPIMEEETFLDAKELDLKYDDYHTFKNAQSISLESGSDEIEIEGDTIHAVGINENPIILKVDEVYYEIRIEKAELAIFLVIGQSNATPGYGGNSTVYPEKGTAYWCNVASGYEMNVPTASAKNMMRNHTLSDKNQTVGGIFRGLADTWYQNTDEKVAIISAAVGGSRITQWQSGDTYTQKAVNAYNEAVNSIDTDYYDIVRAGYFWLQGETDDQFEMTAENYYKKFTAMDSAIRLKCASAPLEFGALLAVRSFASKEGYCAPDNIVLSGPRAAQMALNNEDNGIYLVSDITDNWYDDESVAKWFTDENVKYKQDAGLTKARGTAGVGVLRNINTAGKSYVTDDGQSRTVSSWYDQHYNVQAYNEIGADAATNLMGILQGQETHSEIAVKSYDGKVLYEPGDDIIVTGMQPVLMPCIVDLSVSDHNVSFETAESSAIIDEFGCISGMKEGDKALLNVMYGADTVSFNIIMEEESSTEPAAAPEAYLWEFDDLTADTLVATTENQTDKIVPDGVKLMDNRLNKQEPGSNALTQKDAYIRDGALTIQHKNFYRMDSEIVLDWKKNWNIEWKGIFNYLNETQMICLETDTSMGYYLYVSSSNNLTPEGEIKIAFGNNANNCFVSFPQEDFVNNHQWILRNLYDEQTGENYISIKNSNSNTWKIFENTDKQKITKRNYGFKNLWGGWTSQNGSGFKNKTGTAAQTVEYIYFQLDEPETTIYHSVTLCSDKLVSDFTNSIPDGGIYRSVLHVKNEGDELPKILTILNADGSVLLPGTDYVWNSETGLLFIYAVAGDLIITDLTDAPEDVLAVAEAKMMILPGEVSVDFGSDQTSVTLSVQNYVNQLLNNGNSNVTAVVAHISGNMFRVHLSKGLASDEVMLTMTIKMAENPDIEIADQAFHIIENTPFEDIRQEAANTEDALKKYVEDIARTALSENAVNVNVNGTGFNAAVAGSRDLVKGKDGLYRFTVTISKGVEFRTTAEKTVIILASPYSGLDDADAVAAAGNAIESGIYNMLQSDVNTESEVKSAIKKKIMVLPGFVETGITVTEHDIIVSSFVPAISGTIANHEGYDGSFEFYVVLKKGKATAQTQLKKGTITASEYAGGESSGNKNSSGDKHDMTQSKTVIVSTIYDNSDSLTRASLIEMPMVTGGKAEVNIVEKQIIYAIQKATDEARKNGILDKGIIVEVKTDIKNQYANEFIVCFDRESVDELVRAKVKGIYLVNNETGIYLDYETVKYIQSVLNSDTRVSIKKIDNNVLTGEAALIAGKGPAYDISITNKKGRKITDFKNHKVLMQIHYELKAEETIAEKKKSD